MPKRSYPTPPWRGMESGWNGITQRERTPAPRKDPKPSPRRWSLMESQAVQVYLEAYEDEVRIEAERLRAAGRHGDADAFVENRLGGGRRLSNRHHASVRRAHRDRRRARQYAVRFESVDRDAIIRRDHSICHLCGEHVEPDDLHLDHIIPLSRGGSHTAENLAVAHGLCNTMKGARLPSELPAIFAHAERALPLGERADTARTH